MSSSDIPRSQQVRLVPLISLIHTKRLMLLACALAATDLALDIYALFAR